MHIKLYGPTPFVGTLFKYLHKISYLVQLEGGGEDGEQRPHGRTGSEDLLDETRGQAAGLGGSQHRQHSAE